MAFAGKQLAGPTYMFRSQSHHPCFPAPTFTSGTPAALEVWKFNQHTALATKAPAKWSGLAPM